MTTLGGAWLPAFLLAVLIIEVQPQRIYSCGVDDFMCDDRHCIERSKKCDGVFDCANHEDERNCDCRPDQFRCERDGRCIEERRRCDGLTDCDDGSDEVGCTCGPDQWQCDHGSCIKRKYRCDGRVDCPTDRSDERNCIASGYFKCKSGQLIPEYLRCNRQYDCLPEDYSDEQNCPCGASDFKCDNGYCIPASKHCDRTHDCQDRSDERDCTYGTVCMAYEYECKSGMCVEADARCNGTVECNDESDETGCPCKRDQFSCRDGSCINIALRCNGHNDCSTGEDEYNCRTYGNDRWPCGDAVYVSGRNRCDDRYFYPNRVDEKTFEPPSLRKGPACESDEIVCPREGTCAVRCNGESECSGGEDEENCPSSGSSEGCNHQCDGRCLPDAKICDQVLDCSDGSDEIGCDNCFRSTDFRCNDGECIEYHLKCNGIDECAQGEDELNCNSTMETNNQPCGPGKFQCIDSGECLSNHLKCDGQNDCIDNSDERDCQETYAWYMTRASRSPVMATCHESEFTCYDGRCIPYNRRCDNFYDCSDFSDEQNCHDMGCDADSFQCQTNAQCIQSVRYCDGFPDCSDGSDEVECPVVPTTYRPLPPTTSNYFYSTRSPEDRDRFGQNGDPRWRGQDPYGQRGDNGGQGSPGQEQGPYGNRGETGPGVGGCSDHQWRCENGPCIDTALRCNGHVDCPFDLSDEFDCPSNSPVALNLKTYPDREEIRYGGDVVLLCRDEGPERAKVRWRKESGQIGAKYTDHGGRLEMERVTNVDAGVYICEAIDFPSYPGSQARVTVVVGPSPTTHNPIIGCQPHEATCSNLQCIPKSAVCNNVQDCSDNSDEDNCNQQGKCEPNQFKCRNGKCVLKTWLCDSDDDCGDNSDEEKCGENVDGQCSAVEFSCKTQNQCIPKSFFCDGPFDCFDGSDELGCLSTHVTVPPSPSKIKLNPGDTLTLRCEAVGVPVPLISWRLNWGHVPAKCTSTSNNGIGILTCVDMQFIDSGAYSCEAMNNKATIFAVPDAIVHVEKTDPCPTGYFNSEARTEQECIPCFCFGQSKQCRSADLFTYSLPTPLGQGGTRLIGIMASPSGDVTVDTQPISSQYYYQPLYNGATVTRSGDTSSRSNAHPYLTLPESNNGNQLKSYGGYIKYTISPHTRVYGYDDSAPTIIIKGKNFGYLFHVHRVSSTTNNLNVEARFTPESWSRYPDGSVPADRADIMMILADIEKILLRADYNNAGVNITDFEMDSADNQGRGPASLVEECTCPAGYEGLSCQKCQSGYLRRKVGPYLGDCVAEPCPAGTYGDPSRGISCKPCPCPLTNRENQFARTCSLGPDGSVVCDCFTGYEGQHCEVCASGYEGNPLIPGNTCNPKQSSNCNPIGTASIRPPDECVCKDNVQGKYCDQCKNETFSLSSDFREGCASCFCSGVTQQCTSSNYRRKTISVQFNIPQIVDQMKVYNSAPARRGSVRYSAPRETSLRPQLQRGVVTVESIERVGGSNVYYWSLPLSFAGDKVTAYGGFLSYVLKNVPSSVDPSYRSNTADVQLISDNKLIFHYFGNFPVSHDGILNASIPINEKGWQRQDGNEVTRSQFLMALADVTTFLVKATYSSGPQLATPESASIDIAEPGGYGPIAHQVEQCACPANYTGTSCEDCSPGYTRKSQLGIYLGQCDPCECNGKSTMCDPATGECYNCADNTDGPACEDCKPGYTKDPYGNCVSDSRPCNCDPRGIATPCDASGVCYCKQNVEGNFCDSCKPGTYGLDLYNRDGCLPCFCSGATTDCHEARHYVRVPIAAPVLGDNYGGYTITDLNAERVLKDNYRPLFQMSELSYDIGFPHDIDLYWSVPVFPGNRVLSYGGTISLRQKFSSETDEMSERGIDAVLDGGHIKIFWTNPNQFRSGESYNYQIPLKEESWQYLDTNMPVTHSDFMNVLSNLKRVLIRATLAKRIYDTNIADVSMDTALEKIDPSRTSATGIEVCRCPPGYKGTSCESCEAGYFKDHNSQCQKCSCNGHECQLDSYGQVVCNCKPPYTGADCGIIGDSSGTTLSPLPSPQESTVTITITSPSIEIKEVGSSVTFTCRAESRYTPGQLPVRWTKSGGLLPLGRYYDDSYGVLTISNLQVSDSGIYICESTDGVNTAQQSVALKVPVVPDRIFYAKGNEMIEPIVDLIYQADKENYEGDRVELECRARGSPTPNISWRRASNRPLPASAQYYENKLIIDDARIEDSGEYSCVASNMLGMSHRIVVINIRTRPQQPVADKLKVSNTKPNVDEGNSIRIVCTGTTDVPAGSINWQRQDNSVFLSNVRSENGVLYVEYAIPENQGIYVCNVPQSNVPPVPILLTVTVKEPIPEVYNMTFASNGNPIKMLKVPTGGSGTIDCNVKGRPAPLIKWTKHDGSFGPGTSQRENTLIISNAQQSDDGYYHCEASVNGQYVTSSYIYVQIEKRERPVVQIYPEGEQPVLLGGQHELQCRVISGTPEPDITWSRSGARPLSSSTQLQPNNVLRFDNIEVNDEGEYICTAHNDAGTATASGIIKVRSPPEISILHEGVPYGTDPPYVQVAVGEPVNVDCRATGIPEPMVSISFNSFEVVPPQPRQASLRIPSANYQNEGYYTCSATSAAGQVTEQFGVVLERGDIGGNTIDEPYSPQDGGSGEGGIDPDSQYGGWTTDNQSPVYVPEGNPATTIECNQSGSAYVKWTRNGNADLQRNARQYENKLIITNATRSDSGIYVCNIYDLNNEVTHAAYTTLVVYSAPRIQISPRVQTVQIGDSPTVECIAEGDDIISISWKPLSRRVQVRGNSLIFNNIELQDAGEYTCTVESRYTTSNDTAKVYVSENSGHARVSHANEQWAHAGSTVHLQCNVTQQDTRTIWTKNSRPLPRSITRKPDGSLFIKQVQKSDSGQYICEIQDKFGRKISSNYIDLHIQGHECLETEFRCYDYSACVDEHLLCDGNKDCQDNSDEENCLLRDKRFSVTLKESLRHDDPRTGPREQLVYIQQPSQRSPFRVGDNVIVLCKALSKDVTTTWFREGTNEYVDAVQYGDGSMLSINSVTYADSGRYRCLGRSSRDGRQSYDVFELRVDSGAGSNVPYYPDENSARISQYSAYLGQSVELPCRYDLEPPVNVEWRKEFSTLGSDFRTNQPNLRFDSVTEADAGTYVCRVSNSRAAVEVRAILTVKGVVPMFTGSSYIALKSLEDVYRQLEIEISFKPTDGNGLILYNCQNPTDVGDFIALQLVNSVPEFIMKTGPAPAKTVRADRPIQLNTWHTIRISRTASKLTMDVDNTGPFIEDNGRLWEEVLEFGTNQRLYIGGVPNYDILPAELVRASGYVGCVSMLVLGTEEKNIMMESLERYAISECNSCVPNLCNNNGFCQEALNERGYTCICATGFAGQNCDRTGEACRPGICGPGKCYDTVGSYKCACPVTHTGANCESKQSIEYPAFTGAAYVAIKAPGPSRTLMISMNIKATNPVTDGIIMYCAESPRGYGGFTSLSVHNGRLEFRYDLGKGSQPVILVSNTTLESKWTSVNIARIGSMVSLKIDSIYSYEQFLPQPYSQQYLPMCPAIYVGGVDDSIVLNKNTGVSGGFNGCIKDFTMHGQAVDIVNETIQSANVQECVAYDRGDIPGDENLIQCQCRNGGQCRRESEPTSCICPAGFTGQLCDYQEPSSMRDRVPSDPCSLRPCQNGGTCRRDPSVRMNYSCDCPLGYAGATCQMRPMINETVGFSGNGYLELPSSELNYGNLEREPVMIAMAIFTHNDGVLLYQGEGHENYGDFILLKIERGVVVLDWDIGGGVSSVRVNEVRVTDGKRHRIIAKIEPFGVASLNVDTHTGTGSSLGINSILNADSNIFIGGMPDYYNQGRYPGFSGCIEQVELMNSSPGINLGAIAIAGRNVQRCKPNKRLVSYVMQEMNGMGNQELNIETAIITSISRTNLRQNNARTMYLH